MARAAIIRATGGPEVIDWVDRDPGEPGAGEVRMRNTVVGLNYIDAYHRSGLYPVELPSGLGMEAAGVVDAIGPEVTSFAVGDRVATFGPPIGAYSTERVMPASSLFKLPDSISDEVAAAAMLKGATAEFLIERCGRVTAGDTVLVHAAAGGVGHLLVQWLHHIGAIVIASVGTAAKADSATEAGADHVVLHRDEDVAARVREITDGRGCAVVFDGVGKATWEISLKSAARRGMIISYGNASGPVDGVNLGILSRHGSLFVARPTLFDYYVTPDERAAGIARLFDLIGSGVVKVEIGARFSLEEAADAHRAMEAGKTQGATLLIP